MIAPSWHTCHVVVFDDGGGLGVVVDVGGHVVVVVVVDGGVGAVVLSGY